jgi:hypothetical protein
MSLAHERQPLPASPREVAIVRGQSFTRAFVFERPAWV